MQNTSLMKVIKIILCISMVMMFFSNLCYADFDPSTFKEVYTNDGKQSTIATAGGKAFGVAATVGNAVAIILLVIAGMKYMFSSVDAKATIKEKLVMYVMGAIMLFAASGIVSLIGNWSTTVINN